MALRKVTTYHYTVIILICHLVSDTASKKLENVSSDPTANLYLKSSRFTHKPRVHNRSFCANSRTFLIGARIRSIKLLNETAQSITAIELICSDRIRNKINPSFFHTKHPLIIEKNVGVWGDIEECPNGLFATGLTFHLQLHPVSTLNNDYDYDLPTIGRSHFISGLTLNCTYNDKKTQTNVSELNVTVSATPFSVTLGHSSDLNVGITCQPKTVISGAEIFEEPTITESKESLAQVKFALKCSHLVNPAKYCTPELMWERIGNVKCHPTVEGANMTSPEVNIPTNSTADTATESPRNGTGGTTCDAQYAVGATMNFKIRNLDSITSAYSPLGLENDRKLGEILLKRLKSHGFRYDWKQRYNLRTTDYNIATQSATMYSILRNATYSFQSSTEIPMALSQVVGYCSIYKIYFPILKQWSLSLSKEKLEIVHYRYPPPSLNFYPKSKRQVVMAHIFQVTNASRISTLKTLKMASPIRQLQGHPTVSVTPSVIKLFQSRDEVNYGYKGTIKIANKAKNVVTFKIMSNSNSSLKVKVRPSHGMLEAGRVAKLHLYANNERVDYARSGLSLLLLVSCCEVLGDPNCDIVMLANFWKKVIRDGSCAFVQVIKLNNFQFIGSSHEMLQNGGRSLKRRRASKYENVQPLNNSSDVDDAYSSGNSERQSSLSSHYQTDSEDGGTENSGSPANRRRRLKMELNETKSLCLKPEESRKFVKMWLIVTAIFVVTKFFHYVQKQMDKVNLSSMLTFRKGN
ncbi:hypothetical protein Ocin01_15773 [Orchesella cincta]|uniref:MSP domain-containing protein n=1 Tax=Orchesella cincta TaxID=48709 RepID=A0A1D2MD84_ORCCI|nr:hypothetical protein Ocin01_15773 [Orchesella cincta]